MSKANESKGKMISEAGAINAKVVVVKGKSGNRYAVFTKQLTPSLGGEYWFNLDQLGDNTEYPRLRLALQVAKTETVYTFKNDNFGALERPRYKKAKIWELMTARDLQWVNRRFREWLTTPTGQSFIERNKIANCPAIKNWLEIASGKRNML